MIPDHKLQRMRRKGFRSKEWQRWAQKRALTLGDERCRGGPGSPVRTYVTRSEGHYEIRQGVVKL